MQHKLIYYYGKALGTSGSIDKDTQGEWELFDLKSDSAEMMNIYDDPAYLNIREELKIELYRLKEESGDYE